MKIADGVDMLEVSSASMGRPVPVNPVLFHDGGTVILVDTGFPGQFPMLKEAVEKAGLSLDGINKVIITHQDIDHIGNLPQIISGSSHKIEVMCGAEDKLYIQGEKKLIKGDPKTRSKMLESMPEERRKAFLQLMENPPHAKVDRTLRDGEELPYCGGIIVIATPGHTPGHICLYHKASKTLVAGDALNISEGKLIGPNPQNAWDLEKAIASVKKMAAYDIKQVITYHGGLFTSDVKAALAAIK